MRDGILASWARRLAAGAAPETHDEQAWRGAIFGQMLCQQVVGLPIGPRWEEPEEAEDE